MKSAQNASRKQRLCAIKLTDGAQAALLGTDSSIFPVKRNIAFLKGRETYLKDKGKAWGVCRSFIMGIKSKRGGFTLKATLSPLIFKEIEEGHLCQEKAAPPGGSLGPGDG